MPRQAWKLCLGARVLRRRSENCAQQHQRRSRGPCLRTRRRRKLDGNGRQCYRPPSCAARALPCRRLTTRSYRCCGQGAAPHMPLRQDARRVERSEGPGEHTIANPKGERDGSFQPTTRGAKSERSGRIMLAWSVRSEASAFLLRSDIFVRGPERRLAMATATQVQRTAVRGAVRVEISPEQAVAPAEPPVTAASELRDQYHCECGHVLRVFGGGRHRRYFELTDSRLDDPVMDRACPQCGRGLPGKNQP
jgi:hypothetical protein